ncbi:hypothetical protein BDP27DRAFT_1331598, partial [Rhodocollybia butyracea]
HSHVFFTASLELRNAYTAHRWTESEFQHNSSWMEAPRYSLARLASDQPPALFQRVPILPRSHDDTTPIQNCYMFN